MEKAGRSYSSGEWLVREGGEEEFVERWTTFIEWTLTQAPGAVSFVLVRSSEEPGRFLSLGAWENQEAQEAWLEMPQMQMILGHCRAVCDQYDTYRYTLAARLGR
jgi:heme-degrading monooxygenase HmoA